MGNLFSSYHAWLKVADAALPRNLIGYIIQICLGVLRTDPFILEPYDEPGEIAKCGKLGKKSFLPQPLPEREGPRPEIGKWMAPHRQISQLTDADTHKLLAIAMEELVVEHAVRAVIKTSAMEKANNAIFIADPIPTPHAIAKATSREIAHVHVDADHSIHALLSPLDCKEVILKKWGERMPLAGSLVPNEYLILYTPRNTEEIKVVKSIVSAAIMFMSGAPEVVGDGAD